MDRGLAWAIVSGVYTMGWAWIGALPLGLTQWDALGPFLRNCPRRPKQWVGVWIRALKCCIAWDHKQWERALHNKLGPVLGAGLGLWPGALAWGPILGP